MDAGVMSYEYVDGLYEVHYQDGSHRSYSAEQVEGYCLETGVDFDQAMHDLRFHS
jgi:hypothetical protein